MKRISNFKFLISNLKRNPFLSGGLIMVVGSNIFNVAQFAYHFFTARSFEKVHGEFLGKAYYGDFAAILSILGIISIIQVSVGLTIIKFIASITSSKETANFARWVNLWSIWLGIFVFIFSLIISPFLAKFLNLTQPSALSFFSLVLFIFIILNSQRSMLQALLRFDRYVLTLLTEAFFKIIFTLVFIFASMAVYGAVMGFLVGAISALVVSRLSLRKILGGERGKKPELAPLLRYSLPALIQGLALTSMYSIDLLLVKHFFSPNDAGTYASLAVLGRVTLFAATPIIHTMFPIVARKYAQGKPFNQIFYLSFLLVFIFSSFITLFYLLFPKIPILLLYGKSYLNGASILWWFSAFMCLVSLSMLFIQFYLSIGKTLVVLLFAAAAILQIILIWFFHSSLLTVVQLSILSVALLLVSLIIYFPYANASKK